MWPSAIENALTDRAGGAPNDWFQGRSVLVGLVQQAACVVPVFASAIITIPGNAKVFPAVPGRTLPESTSDTRRGCIATKADSIQE